MRRFSLQRTLAILQKEFIQLKRDKLTLKMIIAVPIMQLLLFGYALNTNPKHLPTAILSQDNSEISRNFINGLKNTQYFSVTHTITSPQEGHQLLRRGDVLFVITIPSNFERNFIRGHHAKILIEADASDPVAIDNAISAANGMLSAVLKTTYEGKTSSQINYPCIEVQTHHLYNPEGFTSYNIIPGLIATILTMTGIMMTSLTMTREQERGTMENLLAMPTSPLEVMVGKIIPYVLISLCQSILIIVCATTLFDIPLIGNLFLFFFALLIFITCNIALGFTISTIVKNQTQALQMSFMMMLPSIMLSGFLFPFLGMPLWAQVLGNLIPATHFIRISRSILLKGSHFIEILPSLWPLVIFMIIITIIAVRCYRQTLD